MGNARVKEKPDATGNAATPTITEQIDAFLASGTFGAKDVVFVSGGISDVIAGMAAVQAGTQTEAAMVAAARKAGEDYAAQIRRLVAAGAKYVVVTGTYDLSKTPWAKAIGREALLADASARFNDGLLVGIVDLGGNVLYVDSAYYVNLYTSSPANFGFNNATAAVCTSVDAANAIGIGAWLGTIMLFNVWGIIWPNQKKILGLKPATDEEKAAARKAALYASRANFILSIPMLLCMAATSHGLPI